MQDEFERELRAAFAAAEEPLADPDFRERLHDELWRAKRRRRLGRTLTAAVLGVVAAAATPWIVAGSVGLSEWLSGLAAATAHLYAHADPLLPAARAATWIVGMLAAGGAGLWLKQRAR